MERKMYEYKDWIRFYDGDIFRNCLKVCQEMKEVFPELTLVKGCVYLQISPKPRDHAWLKTPNGEIVDPTKDQWDSHIIRYEEYPDEEPRGRCINCGKTSFYSQNACSEICQKKIIDHLS